jgi:hypothetical protein
MHTFLLLCPFSPIVGGGGASPRVIPRGQHADRRDRQRERRYQSRHATEAPCHQPVENQDGEDTRQRLGEQQPGPSEPEQLDACDLEPEAEQWLVDDDEPAGIEGDDPFCAPKMMDR